MSASILDAMENEKTAVKRAMAHESEFRDEKRRIVESLGGSPADLITPSADARVERKLKEKSSRSTAMPSLLSRGSARGFQQANDAPEESPQDDPPTALDHSEEEEEQRGPRFEKRTWYITVAVVLLVVIGGVVGVVVALTSRGGTSSSSLTDGTTGSDNADEMCQLDREALANFCENGGLAVPDCAADTYQDLTDIYAELLPVGVSECTAAHQGLVALAASQVNYGEDVTDPILFFAMSTLYFALKGTQWRVDTNWLEGPTPCGDAGWYGLECSDDGSPISVSLENNLLHGSLPTEVGLLSNLRDLEIGVNEVSGSLPSEIGLLVKLKTLNFYLTSIHSQLPPDIGMLKELTQFRSQSAPLTGSIPSEIGNMSNLEMLEFDGNDFTGTLPTELGNLVQLRTLILASLYGVTGMVPSELVALARLEELSIIDLAAVDLFPLPEVITVVTNLRVIDIANSPATGSLPMMAHLSHLEVLRLTSLFLTGTIPTEIGMLTNLGILAFDSANIRGTIPSEIGLLTKLRTLEIRDESRMTGGIPSELGSLTALERLDVSNTGLDGTIPEEVCALSLPTPAFFVFDNCKFSSNQANGCFWATCVT